MSTRRVFNSSSRAVDPIVKNRLLFYDQSIHTVSVPILSNSEALLAQPHADSLAEVSSDSENDTCNPAVSRGGVVTPFPWKLHEMLENVEGDGFSHLVSWQSHGRAFVVKDSVRFVEKVMPFYFKQSKFASFQRQLNLYGFRRLTQGKDKGCYFHDCFLRGKRSLCNEMSRQKVKGTKVRRAILEMEPDLYQLPCIPSQQCDEAVGTMGSHILATQEQPLTCFLWNSEVKCQPTPVLSNMPSDKKDIPIPPFEADNKPGDLLFFEGLPFHYLDNHFTVDGSVTMEFTMYSAQTA